MTETLSLVQGEGIEEFMSETPPRCAQTPLN